MRLPEEWVDIWAESVREQGTAWAARYGEESLKAAMYLMGDLSDEEAGEPLELPDVPGYWPPPSGAAASDSETDPGTDT